jgi:hypothetical protein
MNRRARLLAGTISVAAALGLIAFPLLHPDWVTFR